MSSKLRVSLKAPHAEQAKFIDSPMKRRIVRAGRRSGKTTASAIFAVRRFLEGARVLYAAPVLEQTDVFWAEVKRALAPAVAEGLFTKSETDRIIEKPGSKQRIKAATAWDADTLRSDYADLLILDEWQLMNESTWQEVGAPMLLDSDGDALFIYTPPSLHSRSVSKADDPRHAAKLFKYAQADMSGRWAAFSFTSHANPHISKAALAEITRDMTALAHKQEILAEDVEEIPGALWTQELIDKSRVSAAPDLVRIVVAIDPSGSSSKRADECGIVVAGVGSDGHGYVLKDLSRRAGPQAWAAAAVTAYHAFKADRIVAETNFGAEMVEVTVRTVDSTVSFKALTASRGKMVRAEPVCALYEQGMIHHCGTFEDLESELCSYVPGNNPSPGRLDALVWALTEVVLSGLSTFGFLDWLKSGAPERLLEELKTRQPAGTMVRQAAPAAEGKPAACPECKWPHIQQAPDGSSRCANCGHQWFPHGKPPVAHAGFDASGRPTVIWRTHEPRGN